MARNKGVADAGMTVLLRMLGITIFGVPIVAAPLGDGGRALIESFFVFVLLSGAWALAEASKAGGVAECKGAA